jgi:hypothetical protein
MRRARDPRHIERLTTCLPHRAVGGGEEGDILGAVFPKKIRRYVP